MSQHEQQTSSSNKRLLGKLSIVALAMFGFGFLLVPLYSVVCDVFGINGRFVDIDSGTYDIAAQTRRAAQLTQNVDRTREVTVQFLASRNQNLNFEFRPLEKKLTLHPGEMGEVKYFAKNLTGRDVVAQAVPSLVPGTAVKYFAKTECFCFTQQTLKAGEGKEMPLRFVVDPALPKNVSTITLAYTFFDTDRGTGPKAKAETKPLRVADATAN